MNTITLTGKIIFEPINLTRKHKSQASWKRIAFVEFEGDICSYYAWFINRRYNIPLNKPIRKAHVSFINDSIKDLSRNGTLSNEEVDRNWEALKQKWNGEEISVVIDLSPRSDGFHWWMNVSERDLLHSIREEVGLGLPYFGLHLSVGYVNPRYEEHSRYIHDLIKEGYIE
jgi:hypothetical protein